ncbi:MAG: spore coat protein CotJB [Ruminococcus sp.]|nr:spore coat protein CotJB [Ruminococcus sp.]
MPMLSEKQTLLRKLQSCGFALLEANLYLDSHPTCRMGLEYFRKHKQRYEELEKEYTDKFGPLRAIDSPGTDKWEWVTSPFPWERGEN